jgi:hypothetical protein
LLLDLKNETSVGAGCCLHFTADLDFVVFVHVSRVTIITEGLGVEELNLPDGRLREGLCDGALAANGI